MMMAGRPWARMNNVNEAAVASKVCTGCGARYPGDALFCPNDGTPLQSPAAAERDAADPYLGQEISGHIEIRQLVGVGAMGRVYRAFQRGIDRDVAVKILHRELSANAQLVSRFTREAKVASRLQHPNVVQVLLAGQLPDRALYMVMEYLDGLSMQSALAAAGGALPLARALHIVVQLAEAAGEAHAQGIVHRDLKPENVMLVTRGADPDFVKVLDFGIARINWGEQSVATAAGLIFGTARYISPEGAQGNAVGPASDVYSIATLLYQMLSGRTPFEGDQAVGLLVQQIHDSPPSLKNVPRAAYVPDPIAEVVMTNLAKDPRKREPDARALGHAILDAAKSAGLSPEDFSRPLLRRPLSAIHLPPTERTKQMDLSPELAECLSPSPAGASSIPPPLPKSNGVNHEPAAPRAPMEATAKWEPPEEFQARLAQATRTSFGDVERTSGIMDVGHTPSAPVPTPPPVQIPLVPSPAPSRPRQSSVDETMDDEPAPAPSSPSVSAPVATRSQSAPTFPPSRGAPKTVPGDPDAVPRTRYDTPTPSPSAFAPASSPQRARTRLESEPPEDEPSSPTRPPISATRGTSPARSRGIVVVALCFVLGMMMAAGWAYKIGKIGGESDSERSVARATDAMYNNHFFEPSGDNVKDITDEGLKRWPNDRRLVDIRNRAAAQLVMQALTQRSGGDIGEALKLAKIARELDPNDESAKRLVDQYEAELTNAPSPSSPPLNRPPNSAISVNGKPPPVPPAPAAGYTVVLEVSAAKPRLGQNVELSARVAPAKGPFENAAFTVIGPANPGGVRLPAQNAGPGAFSATYAFVEGGRYQITFIAQAEGKPLASTPRVLVAGETAPPTPPTPPTAPTPTTTPSVKWM